MRRLSSNALPGIMLVIIIFWALFAVLLLTGILSTANRIESRVGVINDSVTPINSKLDNVAVLTQVQDTAGQIRDAAAPLSGIIGNVATSAASIDNSAKQILGTAQSINTSAKTINASVLEINTSVSSITSQLETILASAQSINGTVNEIGLTFIELTDVVVLDIKPEVVLINDNVTDVIRSVNGILGDFDSVIVQVDLINNNAQGIASSPLIMNAGNSGVMSEMVKASSGQGPAAQAGLPAFGLLPAVPELGIPALPLPPMAQLPLDLSKILQGLPLLSDAGNVLSLMSASPPK